MRVTVCDPRPSVLALMNSLPAAMLSALVTDSNQAGFQLEPAFPGSRPNYYVRVDSSLAYDSIFVAG